MEATISTEQNDITDDLNLLCSDLVLDDPDQEDTDDTDLDDDLDGLDDLDLLMQESTAQADAKRLAKRQQFMNGLSLPWVEADKYLTRFTCALFIQTTCTHCGSLTSTFSHFAEYQEFSKKLTSKPNIWKRISERPSALSTPRFIPAVASGCGCCTSNTDAINIYESITGDKHE